MSEVEYPRMRSDVLDALRSLSDRDYQEREWGVYRTAENIYDDLTLNVNLLYDDCRVLPDPAGRVGSVLLPQDVEPLIQLGLVLDPLIEELGDDPDDVYLADPRWDGVVRAAAAAVTAFEQTRPAE